MTPPPRDRQLPISCDPTALFAIASALERAADQARNGLVPDLRAAADYATLAARALRERVDPPRVVFRRLGPNRYEVGVEGGPLEVHESDLLGVEAAWSAFALDALVGHLPTCLFTTGGRSTAIVRKAIREQGAAWADRSGCRPLASAFAGIRTARGALVLPRAPIVITT